MLVSSCKTRLRFDVQCKMCWCRLVGQRVGLALDPGSVSDLCRAFWARGVGCFIAAASSFGMATFIAPGVLRRVTPGCFTSFARQLEDEKYRNSQQAHGWTEEFCRYLDYLTTIDISYTAPSHQRHRCESTITLVCNHDDRQAGPMRARRDFRPTTKILASLRQEQGRQISFNF